MKKLNALYFLIILSLVFTLNVRAQTERKINIEYAGRLNFNEEKHPGAKILTRDDSQQIHLSQADIHLWSDKVIYYSETNFVEAYGNVKLIQGDTINLTSKYIEYSGPAQLAFASGDVVLKDPNSTLTTDTLYYDRKNQVSFYRSGGKVEKDSSGVITSKIAKYLMNEKKYRFVNDVELVNKDATLNSNFFDFYSDTGKAYLYGPSTITTDSSKTYCEKGYYDTKNKVGYGVKKTQINYSDRVFYGDSLYFDDNLKFATASNNIKILDSINKTVIKGHYAEVYQLKDSVFITNRAVAASKQQNDSIYLHAEKLMITGKPEARILRAFYDAKIYKSDISGKADSIHANQQNGLIQLINLNKFKVKDKFSKTRKPIFWNDENQMTGDTIHLYANTKTEKLDSLLVFNNAFIISKDTLMDDAYNQINGLKLLGLFTPTNQLKQVDIIKNAQSIFYTRNENHELVGIDKAKSGSITMLFNDGDIEEYTRFNQVDGTLDPESIFDKKNKIFKDFDWRPDERLKVVSDLFKDDPKLELPIIKGLDDYVPEKEFFDADMIARIKSTKSMTVPTPQNTPAPTLIPSPSNPKKPAPKTGPVGIKPNAVKPNPNATKPKPNTAKGNTKAKPTKKVTPNPKPKTAVPVKKNPKQAVK